MSRGAIRSILLAGLLLAACVRLGGESSPPRLLLLEPGIVPRQAPAELPGPRQVAVLPAQVPAYLDRPQLVTRKSADEIVYLQGVRWAEPLQQGVSRVLAMDLGRLQPNLRFLAGNPLPGQIPGFELQLRLSRFDAGPGATATLEAEWVLTRAAQRAVVDQGQLRQTTVRQAGAQGLAAALTELLAGCARSLAPRIAAAASEQAAPGAPHD